MCGKRQWDTRDPWKVEVLHSDDGQVSRDKLGGKKGV